MSTIKLKVYVEREDKSHYTKEWDAIQVAPGLAVHQNFPVGCSALKKDLWTISHIGSGLAVITDLPDRQTAKKLAKKLAPIIDWEKFSGNAKKVKKEKFDRIVALLNEYS